MVEKNENNASPAADAPIAVNAYANLEAGKVGNMLSGFLENKQVGTYEYLFLLFTKFVIVASLVVCTVGVVTWMVLQINNAIQLVWRTLVPIPSPVCIAHPYCVSCCPNSNPGLISLPLLPIDPRDFNFASFDPFNLLNSFGLFSYVARGAAFGYMVVARIGWSLEDS